MNVFCAEICFPLWENRTDHFVWLNKLKVHNVGYQGDLLAEIEYSIYMYVLYKCIIACNYKSLRFSKLTMNPFNLYRGQVHLYRGAMLLCYSGPEWTNV